MIYDELLREPLRKAEYVIYDRFVSAFSEPQTELQFGTHKSTALPTAVFLCLKIGLGFGAPRPALLPRPKKTALAEARTVPPFTPYEASK